MGLLNDKIKKHKSTPSQESYLNGKALNSVSCEIFISFNTNMAQASEAREQLMCFTMYISGNSSSSVGRP